MSTLASKINEDPANYRVVVKGTNNVGGTLIDCLDELGVGDKIGGLLARSGNIMMPTVDEVRKFRNGGAERGELLAKRDNTNLTWNEIAQELKDQGFTPILIDASNDPELGKYETLLENRFRLFTMNKYESALNEAKKAKMAMNDPFYGYDATVMAGQGAIQRLQQEMNVPVGDIMSVSGIFSGTLAYITKEMEKGIPFSDAVYQAMKLGYTEPHPMDDLDGMDVAKKLVIIARTLGYDVGIDDVEIEGLLEDSFRSLFDEIKGFVESNYDLDNLAPGEQDKINESIRRMYAESIAQSGKNNEFSTMLKENKGLVPRYIATMNIVDGRPQMKVSLQFVKVDSELGSAEKNKLVVEINRDRKPLDQDPEIDVFGPLGNGAGPYATAVGTLRDVDRGLERKAA